MNTVIKINSRICEEIVKHCKIDITRECGGFLFGKYYNNYENIAIIINGIYYENLFGTKNSFAFSTVYYNNALTFRKSIKKVNKDFDFIGSYHSHAKQALVFTDADRNVEKFFGKKTCSIIYSPVLNKLKGEIITDKLVSIPARITLLEKNEVINNYPVLTRKPSQTYIQL